MSATDSTFATLTTLTSWLPPPLLYSLHAIVCQLLVHWSLQFAEADVSPPVAAAHGAFVAVSLGDGVVGLFESRMPFKEPDLLPLHAMSRPLAILAMLLVGGWQFVRTK